MKMNKYVLIGIIAAVVVALTVGLVLILTRDKTPDNPDTTMPPQAATVEYVSAVLANSMPTKVVTNSTYVLDATTTLKGTATLLVKDGLDAKYEYEIEILNPATEKELIGTLHDVVYTKSNNMLASFPEDQDGVKWSGYRASVQLGKINLPENATVVEKDGGVELTATVAAAKSQATFGEAIAATGNITFTLFVKDDKIVSFSMSYATAEGQMTITSAYSYEKVSFSVSKPE